MSGSRNDELTDVAILTRSVENVFRKLIRFLVGRISLVKLQEMINFIYIEEAENIIRKKNPGKNVPLSKLALISGLDTRTVAGIRKKIESSGQLYQQKLLRELTPETAIVEAWAYNVEKSIGCQKESARILSFGSDDAEFEKLFRATITARGVTTRSVLDRLVASNCVVRHEDSKTVELIVDKYSPYLSADEGQFVISALTAISNLISTIEFNSKVTTGKRYFQRQVWTYKISPEKISDLRAVLTNFLVEQENEARNIITPWESDETGYESLAMGVGLYYFEEAEEAHSSKSDHSI